MATKVGAGGGWQSEINVTPLVDVVLVLLIIFMVVIPLARHGYDVDIPRRAVEPIKADHPGRQIVLVIDAARCAIDRPLEPGDLPRDCIVSVIGEEVGLGNLAQRMEDEFAARRTQDRVLFLDAADELNYEGVMRILDIAKSRVEGLRVGLVFDRDRHGTGSSTVAVANRTASDPRGAVR